MTSLFKGDNVTISLVEEDQGWGKPPSTYAGGKYFQTNDGSFEETRGTIESEARTSNAQLSGMRLGNKNVTGSFPVEIDPENYNKLLESSLYGRFKTEGTEQSLTSAAIFATKAYELRVPMSSGQQTSLGAKVGNFYQLSGISAASLQSLAGVCVLSETTATELVFYCIEQLEPTLAATDSDITITPVSTLRPDRQLLSFNAEETLFSEDGLITARFLTAGCISSGFSLDIQSEAAVTSTFSMLAAGKHPSKKYEDFDDNLTNSQAAHTAVIPHVNYDPLIIQDGAIISGEENIRCEWISGTINLENGTETTFVGCSFDAIGSVSGQLRITVEYEALFQSEDDFIRFQTEESSKLLLKLKDRASEKSLLLYIPNLKLSAYTPNISTGLVTANISGSAIIDEAAIDSIIMGAFNG